MDPSIPLLSGDEWLSQRDCFSKLEDYFDRPDWWDEGAQAIGSFFDETKSPVNSPDQRLEDLLQSLEPFTVTERPVRSKEKELNGRALADENVDWSSSHREQHLSVHDPNSKQIKQSSQAGQQAPKEVLVPVQPEQASGLENIDENTDSSLLASQNSSPDFRHAEAETTEPSNDLSLQKEILIDSALQRSNEFASSNIININKTSHSPSFEAAFSERSLPKLGATIANDAVATSSPAFTGTITSTRQTSVQPELSTRASSVSSSSTTNINISPEKNASPSASFENDDEPLKPPEVPIDSTGLPKDDRSILLGDVAIPTSTEYTVHDDPVDEDNDDIETTAAATQIDPAGLQAIKDEFSEQYGLEPAHDSSFLSQDDDITVVHDPTSAAISFFPPNPYSADPVDYDYGGLSLTENRAISAVQDALPDHVLQDASLDESTQLPVSSRNEQPDKKDQVDVQDTVETSTAPSILPVVYGLDSLLPHGEQRLPASFLEESSDQVKIRDDTPPAPPTSLLTPPADYLGAGLTDDKDAVNGAAEEEDDGVQTTVPPSILSKALLKLGKITPNKATTTGESWSGDALETIREADDELTQDMVQDQEEDETGMSAASEDVIDRKRKQNQAHADESPYKKRLSAIPEHEDQLAIETTESIAVAKGATEKSKSKVPIQKSKDIPVARSYHRDSTDELAGPPTSTPFALNKGKGVLSLVKARPKRETPSRPGARNAATTTKASSAISKTTAAPSTSRKGGVGSKELAGLVESSPPRKAVEKAKANLGSRLRSQSNTPTPAATKQAAVVAAKQTPDTSTEPKRKRLPGLNPLGGRELIDLGTIVETKTRTRNSTVESVSQSSTESAAEHPSKRSKNAIPGYDLEHLGAVVESRTRSRNSTVEPVSEPSTGAKAKAAPSERVRKPAAKPAAKPAVKPATKANPFLLVPRSMGTPAASRRKPLAKTKAAEPEQEEDTTLANLSRTNGKRKRQIEDKDAEEVATRQSKRIAGAKAQEK